MKRPYIKFWINDYRNDPEVKLMDFETRGFYLEMIFECWLWNGKLPSDINKLSTVMNTNTRTCKRLLAKCCFKWQLNDGWFTNSRVTQEILKITEKSNKCRESANIRHHGGANATSNASSFDMPLIAHSSDTEYNVSVNSKVMTSPSEQLSQNKTEPKTEVSKQTGWVISQEIKAHKAIFTPDVMKDSPMMKKLLTRLLNVREIKTPEIKLLAYIIQAKTAKKPKNQEERVSYAISLVKNAKYAPADSAMVTAKELIQNWTDESGAAKQVANLVKVRELDY